MVPTNPTKGISLGRKNEKIKRITTPEELEELKKLREIGLSRDIIMCRSNYTLTESVAEKIALFCNVPKSHVIEGKEVKSIYEVPLVFDKQKMGQIIMNRLELDGQPQVTKLNNFISP